MVVFTCNHCGESVHKPAVEKHYNFACRKYKDLTCVDCFKDFRGEDFAAHTKCLTEDERYAAKGSMPIGVQKKGEAKQEAWVDMIRAIIQEDINMKPQNKNLLLTISKHNNVPRKKQKFLNYIKSVTGGKISENIISEVWDIIENYKEKHAKLNKSTKETGKKEENNSNSEIIETKSEENSAEKAPKTTKRKDVDNPNEAASPKKSKKEKSKAAKEIEEVEEETNSLEPSTPNRKRKQNNIATNNENKQKKNGTLETNDKLEENSTSKKKKQKETDNGVATLIENENQENGLLKTDEKKKKKKNKNSKSEDTDGNNMNSETDKNVSEINGQNGLTQLDDSLKDNEENNSLKADKKKKKKNKNSKSDEINTNGVNLEKTNRNISEINEQNDLTQLDESSLIENGQENDKSFVIEDVILNILNKKNEISIVKLEKKVTTKYLKHTQETEVSQKFIKKFHKKLNKCEKVEVADNIVKLKNVLFNDVK